MFNFDIPRYEKVVGDAIALRPQIEKAVDEVCAGVFQYLLHWMRRNLCTFSSNEILDGYHIKY